MICFLHLGIFAYWNIKLCRTIDGYEICSGNGIPGLVNMMRFGDLYMSISSYSFLKCFTIISTSMYMRMRVEVSNYSLGRRETYPENIQNFWSFSYLTHEKSAPGDQSLPMLKLVKVAIRITIV